MRHVVAIDQGTTGTTVLVLDEQLRVRGPQLPASSARSIPEPGWVEHDPEEIWRSVTRGPGAAPWPRPASTPARSPPSASPTSARPRCCGSAARWRPVQNAIVWQDRRTADDVRARCSAAGHEAWCASAPAWCSTPTSAAPSCAGCSTHDAGPAPARRPRRARASAPSTASWWRASPAARCTSPTSRTRRARCCASCARSTGTTSCASCSSVPRALLPEVRVLGRGLRHHPRRARPARRHPHRRHRRRPAGGAVRPGLLRPGDAKCTYGTGAFILMNTGAEPVPSRARPAHHRGLEAGRRRRGRRCLRARGHRLHRRRRGAVAARRARPHRAGGRGRGAGRARCPTRAASWSCPPSPAWARRTGGPRRAASSPGSPAAPPPAHLARATLEGIALQNVDILERDGERLRPHASTILQGRRRRGRQRPAHAVPGRRAGRRHRRGPQILETTALGAAFLAGLGAGVWTAARARSPGSGARSGAFRRPPTAARCRPTSRAGTWRSQRA